MVEILDRDIERAESDRNDARERRDRLTLEKIAIEHSIAKLQAPSDIRKVAAALSIATESTQPEPFEPKPGEPYWMVERAGSPSWTMRITNGWIWTDSAGQGKTWANKFRTQSDALAEMFAIAAADALVETFVIGGSIGGAVTEVPAEMLVTEHVEEPLA